ncbi:hypothetical protein FBEOM_2297 [Fusarium beomiforme]|uniref:Uncharacterized protein n=1 Tax=Fusarium beomiforme TaxID=44412 RepID=A0A9P5ARN4_9HYPO|nr:hypothetical protein FBEOM_2297 [Fusarium beomiforme]
MPLTVEEARELSRNTVTAVSLGKLHLMDHKAFDGYMAHRNFKKFVFEIVGLGSSFPPHLRFAMVKLWAYEASRSL